MYWILGIFLPSPDLCQKKIGWPVPNLLDQGKEEITLLHADMKNVDNWSEHRAIFSTSLADARSRGASAESKGKVVHVITASRILSYTVA